MEFETEIGIGEIVGRDTYGKDGELIATHLLKVVAICIDADRVATYHCEYPESGYVRGYKSCEIEGDPEFNQVTGEYPEE